MAFVRIVTPPRHNALTTLAVVRESNGITVVDSALDQWLLDRIDDASRLIEEELNKAVVRRRVIERFEGNNMTTFALDVTPVVSWESLFGADVGEVDLSEDDVGNERYRIEDPAVGTIWKEGGWPAEPPVVVGLVVDPVPQRGRRSWEAGYVGGYLTRSDDISASGVDVDESVSGGGRVSGITSMPILVPGDVVAFIGWSLNSGKRVVTEVFEDGFSVDPDGEALSDEVGPAGAQILVRTVPSVYERACVEAVGAWYYKKTNPASGNVKSERIGDWSATYGSPTSGGSVAETVLPAHVIASLSKYRRL
jgi:hypothetical protein